MTSEIVSALTALNLLKQMAKSALDAHTQVERNKVLLDLGETILDLHGRILAIQLQGEELLRIKGEAEEKLKRYEQWEIERAKYALTEPAAGVFVYALKPEHVGEQPSHWLCPKCYEDRKKSILQYEFRMDPRRFEGRRCPECRTDFQF